MSKCDNETSTTKEISRTSLKQNELSLFDLIQLSNDDLTGKRFCTVFSSETDNVDENK